MKPTAEIEARIRYLLCAELSRRVMEAETRLPHLCVHNHRQPLDTRKTVEDLPNEAYNRTTDPEHRGLPVAQTIGLCMLGAEDITSWPGNICEDPIDAQRCPYFNPSTSKTVIFERFKANMGDVEWVQQNMPEAYALLWVLESVGVTLPWWKRLWFAMLRIHVAPVVTADTVLQLLPPSPPEA
jgi:hypothetical protein